MLTESPIHHVAFLNCFLTYNASFFESSDEKWPIEELCTSDMAALALRVREGGVIAFLNYFLAYIHFHTALHCAAVCMYIYHS